MFKNVHLFSNVDVNAISDPTESDHEENTNKFERIDVELETNRLWIENGAHQFAFSGSETCL